MPSYLIDDQTAIQVTDDGIEVISERNWRLIISNRWFRKRDCKVLVLIVQILVGGTPTREYECLGVVVPWPFNERSNGNFVLQINFHLFDGNLFV